MKRALVLLALSLMLAGCMSIHDRIDRARFGENPYVEAPFYMRYVSSGNGLDRRIQAYVEALRADPGNPVYHNELGRLLVRKGFPNDARREFHRALAADRDFHPAWYNLGLVRASLGDRSGALRAFEETLERKPGHAAALFQKGLLLEQRGRTDAAVDAYAKAFRINFDLLQPSVNPQIVDSRLVELALLRLYPQEHRRRALVFEPTPPELIPEPEAPSELTSPEEIVPPASPDPASPPAPGETAAPPPGG